MDEENASAFPCAELPGRLEDPQERGAMNRAYGKRDFDGKIAFVTGAASAIGRVGALACALEGANVAVVDVAEDGNRETAQLIEEAGGRPLALRCDVTRAADVQAALKDTTDAFGRLDFAFNNAGLEPKRLVPTAEVDQEEWDRIMAINLRG